MLGAWAQTSYTFNAVALNVDGLPEEISGYTVNKGAPGADGATELCKAIANSGWDFVGFSEDFNFHGELTAAPASTYYNFGEHGGTVSGLTNSTDGLGFACAKYLAMSGGSKVKWNDYYGGGGILDALGDNGPGENGADEMINKGYRMYTVTFATGVEVDVYVLHMDAGTADEGDSDDLKNGKDRNVIAREAQLTQLATAIKTNIAKNKRPVIVLGDTNCRYTREALKTGFIDVINAVSGLTIKDAWVEHMWGGAYPEYGGDAMMTDTYGAQKGEVVDKVFYINTTESNLTLKANSYLHDTGIKVSDHFPVVVNFTLTDESSDPLTDAEKQEKWTLKEKEPTLEKPTWEGEQVASGTAYYMMNVGTGEYIKWGGAYYTEAVGGNGGTPITPTTSDGGATWVFTTSRGRLGFPNNGTDIYLDAAAEFATWYIEHISGTSYQYRIRSANDLYLSATPSEIAKPIRRVNYNADDDNQKWIFLTDARIRTEMTKANADYPFNFTALLKSADFDVIEFEDGLTNANWTGFDCTANNGSGNGPFIGRGYNYQWNANIYSSFASTEQTAAATMSQSLGTLPNGVYDVSFVGFYRSQTSSGDETISAAVKFGSTSISVAQNKNVNIGDYAAAEQYFRVENKTYVTNKQVTLNSSTSVTLTVTKPKSSSSGWMCIDNFGMKYYGTGAVVDPYEAYKATVLEKVNKTYESVILLNAAGQAAYDITTVAYRYDNNLITSQADAEVLCDMVDNAYANAKAAHQAAIVAEAVDNMEANDGWVTGAIINPSFETGDFTGWTQATREGWMDTNIKSDGGETGKDGDYRLNSWRKNSDVPAVTQTVKGLKNGLYELTALIASDPNNIIYIIGNGYHVGKAAQKADTFVESKLLFLVEDGTATIGVVGGNNGYYYKDGVWFKADGFRLKYICDVPHGRLKLALDEAQSVTLDAYGQAALNLSSYETAYNNKSLTTNGKTESAAIYTALQTAAKAQRTKNADMTWAIENPNFETGDYKGWSTTTGWDTGVKSQESDIAAVGVDGRYLFNTWNDWVDATNSGVNAAITQTVSGIPNGTYKLSAMVSSDAENKINFMANGETATVTVSKGKDSGEFPEVTCEVTNHTLDISVQGVNSVWYKCDNFRLTFLGHEITLEDTQTSAATIDDWYTKATLNRTIKQGKWATFVCPFDIPAAALAEWDIKELDPDNSVLSGDKITIRFVDAKDGIKAGVPYMVRNTTMADDLNAITLENVTVNTTAHNTENEHVHFVGTYKKMAIPEGAFFISDNTFYQAEDDSNTIKAFRAYFTTKEGTKARSLGYRFAGDDDEGEGGTTAIDSPDGEVTVVGIYTTAGVRTDELNEGVNILRMSDGTTIKVVIK